MPTWQVPRGFTEQHAPQNGSTEKDLTENGQFSSKVKSAKIHPRSSRNRNRPQTREETEKVVKGLTLRMAKARCDSSTWRNGWAPCRKPVHVLPGGAAECAKPPPPPDGTATQEQEPGACLSLSNGQPGAARATCMPVPGWQLSTPQASHLQSCRAASLRGEG